MSSVTDTDWFRSTTNVDDNARSASHGRGEEETALNSDVMWVSGSNLCLLGIERFEARLNLAERQRGRHRATR